MAKKRPKQATLDALFSKLVRELADYRCEVCGRSYRHEPGGLHCSHHLSRSHGATRWQLSNASAKCLECHAKMDRNPLLHVDWIRERLGVEKYEALKARGNELMKMTDKDRKELAVELREQLKEAERLNR